MRRGAGPGRFRRRPSALCPEPRTFPVTDDSSPQIAILLATYNGADGLRAQLDSHAAQTVPPSLILISDDGSTDGTRAVIGAFAEAHPGLRVVLLDGPGTGAAQNFLNLLRHCPDGVDFAAFSDQDDVWLEDKLARGLAALRAAGAGDARPRLFCGRSWECDATLRRRRLSPGLRRPPGFRHALVQNLASGNTMMLDRAGLALLRGASREAGELVVHDWWVYQMVAGAGGEVIFDPRPLLLYRQHGGNLIGANRGLRAKRRRLRMLFAGRFRRWNTINIAALRVSAHRLTAENREILQRFADGRDGPLPARLAMLRRTGLYRQGWQAQLSLYLAALLRRI